MIEKSLAMSTALVPVIGYDAAAAIAKASSETGRSVREIAMERNVLPAERLSQILEPLEMTNPGIRREKG